MPTWSPPDSEEVFRVYEALACAFLAERPKLTREHLLALPSLAAPRSPRAKALWTPLRLAWAARARFVRASLANDGPKGARLASLDDETRDRAIANLEKAQSLIANAAELLASDAQAIDKLGKKYGQAMLTEQRHLDAQNIQELAENVESELSGLKVHEGIRQILTQREWDLFVSESAEALKEAGFKSRTVAALLTGTPEEEIDRATMERFRQRVRRQRLTPEQRRSEQNT